MEYIEGKGVLVGTYNEIEVSNGKHKIDVQKMKKETGYEYTNTEIIKKRNKVIGMRIYVCTMEDFKL